MNFDALKNEWRQQQAPDASIRQNDDSLTERLRKTQQKLLISNFFATLGLIIGLGGIGWGWIAMPDGDTAYFVNLLMVSLLIITTAWLMWTRLLFWKKPDFSLDNQTFIRQTLRRLKRTPWMTRRIIPIYASLLFIFMAFHIMTTLASASAVIKFAALGGLSIYFVLVYVLSMRYHRRKQRKEVEPLIRELEDVLNASQDKI